MLHNYQRLIKYLSDYLTLHKEPPSAQAIKEIFRDPEERCVIIQMTGFCRNEIPDSEYETIACHVGQLRKGTLFKGLIS